MIFNKISSDDINEFNRVLSLMLTARMSLTNSLELIVKQTKSEKFKAVLKSVLNNVKKGSSLSESFAKHANVFSEIYIANIKVAEETGNIAEVLNEYTDYQEKFLELKQKISIAARYPIFVVIVTFLALFFMLFFLIPTFGSLFQSMKTEVPPLTKFLLTVSEFLTENGFIFLVVLLLLVWGINYLAGNENFKRNYWDHVLVKIPYFKTLFIKNLLSRFSLSMGVLLKSGVTLVDALRISKNISPNSLFKKEISTLIKNLEKGISITANINKSVFFDRTFSRLIAAGEESAELDKVFYLVSDFYNRDFEYKLKNLTSLIEPLLIMIIGLVVAVILIAMYLPMFELINFMGA